MWSATAGRPSGTSGRSPLSGQDLHTRSDVDAVAEEIVALDHNVADIDPYAEAKPLVCGYPFVASRGFLLNLDGCFNRLHGACKFGDDAVASATKDTPVMKDDQPVHGLAM